MADLSRERQETEARIVARVMMRGAFMPGERAQVEATARQAITVVVETARRIGHAGQPLTGNAMFDAVARRWSPSYGRALETTPARRPHEMKPKTLEAAREDLRGAGLRLGPLFAVATRASRDLFKVARTGKGLRRRPRLKAVLRLPAMARRRSAP